MHSFISSFFHLLATQKKDWSQDRTPKRALQCAKAQHSIWLPRLSLTQRKILSFRTKKTHTPSALEKIHSFCERGRSQSYLALLEGQVTLLSPESDTNTSAITRGRTGHSHQRILWSQGGILAGRHGNGKEWLKSHTPNAQVHSTVSDEDWSQVLLPQQGHCTK